MIQSIKYTLLLVTVAFARIELQCNPHSNGTTFNEEAGSEQQLDSTTIRSFNAPDAIQGFAVHADYCYSIDDYSITKHNKTTSKRLLQWYGGEEGPIIHLDGEFLINGTIYCPHSNYPSSPKTSSVEMWDADTL
jgi:hypothetical protein